MTNKIIYTLNPSISNYPEWFFSSIKVDSGGLDSVEIIRERIKDSKETKKMQLINGYIYRTKDGKEVIAYKDWLGWFLYSTKDNKFYATIDSGDPLKVLDKCLGKAKIEVDNTYIPLRLNNKYLDSNGELCYVTDVLYPTINRRSDAHYLVVTASGEEYKYYSAKNCIGNSNVTIVAHLGEADPDELPKPKLAVKVGNKYKDSGDNVIFIVSVCNDKFVGCTGSYIGIKSNYYSDGTAEDRFTFDLVEDLGQFKLVRGLI